MVMVPAGSVPVVPHLGCLPRVSLPVLVAAVQPLAPHRSGRSCRDSLCGVSAAVAASFVALRSRRLAITARKAGESDASGTRLVRKKKDKPLGSLIDEVQVAEKRKNFVCDCDHIYNTIIEVNDVLTDAECKILIDAADDKAATIGWGAVKHQQYATEDVKVWNLGSRRAMDIFKNRLVEPMRVTIAKHFKLPKASVQVDDGFVVRYTGGSQRSLAFHRDGAIVSGIFSLSNSADYEGGGTSFRGGKTYRPEKGSGIVFAGQRLHSGVEITSGSRYICTLFFKCGELSCKDVAEARDAESNSSDLFGKVSSLFGFGS